MDVDVDLARDLTFRSAVDASRDMTRRAPGGVVHDEDGVVYMAGPHSLPMLVNAVARVEPGLSAEEVMERARAFFAPRERGFSIFAMVGRDDDLLDATTAAGFMRLGDPAPLMAIGEPPTAVDVPAGMRVEEAVSPAHVADIVAICADAYAVYGMPDDVAAAVMQPPSILLAPHIAAYVAYDLEGPIATATSLGTHGTAYLQWVGTMQRGFGRGAGAAVTQAATIGGFERGASMATLFASRMGAPVYRRLGWIDVGLVATPFTLPAD